MDLQSTINAISDMLEAQRSQYHVTLGELITTLRLCPGDCIVSFDHGNHPFNPDSYRGYYSDLALESSINKITATELLEILEEANGKIYKGYKGGDYTMTDDTPLWNSKYGCTGAAIVNVKNDGFDKLILVTKQID